MFDDQGSSELQIAAQNNNLQKVWSIMKKHISNQDLNIKNIIYYNQASIEV